MQRLFSSFFVVVAALVTLFSANCVVAQSAANTVTGIQNLTTTSANLDVTVQNINTFNCPSNCPQVPQIFGQIVDSCNQLAQSLEDPPFTDDEATQIVGALREFVQVHQDLLATVSGKHGVLAEFGFAEPVRIALVALEGAIDSFVLNLINLIPTQASEGVSSKNDLDSALTATINVYSS